MKKYTTDRRAVLKSVIAGSALGTSGLLSSHRGQSSERESLSLKVAGYGYDRVRAISDGVVGIDGVDINFHAESIY